MITIFSGSDDFACPKDIPAGLEELAGRMGRLNCLMQNPMALARVRQDGSVELLFVCERFAQWHGTSRETLLRDGWTSLETLAAGETDWFMASAKTFMNTETICRKQFLLRVDGRPDRWIELHASHELMKTDGSAIWSLVLTDITERKLLELAARDETSLSRHFLDESIDGIVILDGHSCSVREVNLSFAAMLGYTPEEMRGMNPWDWDAAYPPGQVRAMACHRTDGKLLFETRMRRKDGSLVDVEISSTSIDYQDLKLFFCVCRNITERKRLEQELREKAELHHALFSSAPDALVILDRNMALVEANERFASLIGYSLEEIEGLHAWDWDADNTREELEAYGKRPVLGTVVPVETVFRRKDGGLVPVEMHAGPLNIGQRELVLCAVRDITARKALEDSARTEATWHQAIFDNSPDSLVVMDREMALVKANPAFAEMLGYTAEEMKGFHAWDWDAKFSREELEHIGRMEEFGDVPPFETLHRRKDGSLVPVEIYATPIRFTGCDLGLCVVRDISARKAAEAALREEAGLREAIFENSPDPMLILDRGMALVDVNPAYCRLAGYSREELSAMHVWDLDAVHSKEEVQEYGRSPQFGNFPPFETTHRRKDGQLVTVEVHSSKWTWLGRELSLCVVQDVTERKRADRELAAREQEVRTLVENSPDGILRYDRQMNRLFNNPAAAEIFGMTPGQLGSESIDTGPMVDKAGYKAALSQVFETGQQLEREFEGLMPDNRTGWGLIRFAPEFDREGRVASVLAIVRDVTKRKQTEMALREQEILHAAMIEQAPLGVVLVDLETLHCVEFNDVACAMLGYTREEFANLTLVDINARLTWDEYAKNRQELSELGQLAFETVHRYKDGSMVDVQVSSRLVEINGRAHSLAFWTDITERKLAEKAALAREQEIRNLVENSSDTIVRYDRNLRRKYVNPAGVKTLGKPQEELIGHSVRTSPALNLDAYVATLKRVFETGQEAELEFPFKAGDGHVAWMSSRFSPEFDRDNAVESVVAIGRDITEMIRQREELHRMAFYDILTGLPNRALLRDRVRQEAAEVKRRGGLFALMILDLDNFKDINDTLGHAAGDRLLRETTKRLTGCIREYDTLSRLGGDEFALLLPGIRSSQDMGAVARTILDTMARPFRIGDRDVFSSASIGIAVYPDDTRSIGELFARADAAMYHAKSKGRNTFQFYDSKLTEAAEMKLSLGAALRQALSRGELELFYQPKVDMPTGRVLGAEALLRWNHPELGLLTPDKFIGIAEDTGIIVEIGRWVLEEACKAVASWNRFREKPLRVAVNLSSRQFAKGDLVATVKEILDGCGCHGSWLEMEITETIMLEDNPAIQAMLESLRGMGSTIAIDDFGTGHSALSYLNRFKVDVLKIDRSFVMGVETDRRKAELVKAFIAVAHALGMGLVAEGVELPVQADFLCASGCTVGQGYLYSRPVRLKDFEALIDASLASCSTGHPDSTD